MPRTDAEWLEVLRAMNPAGHETEVVLEAESVPRRAGGANADLPAGRRPAGAIGGPDAAPPPPGVVTLLAGEFAADVAAIWTGPRVADYLTAPDRQRHVWHCWLASPRGDAVRSAEADPLRLHDYLTRSKAKDLLRDAYGIVAPGLVAALSRCGTQARQRDFYPALVEALARQDLGAKHIRHRPNMTDVMVMSIAALPSALQSKPLFAKLGPGWHDDEDLAQVCWTLKRLAELGRPEATQHVLNSRNAMLALSEAVASLPFPEPPWPGTDRLQPVRSCERLRTIGCFLGNCLHGRAEHYAMKVMNDTNYYYEWMGDTPAIVTCRCIKPLGWAVEEGYRSNNDPIDAATWSEIKAALASWSDLAPVWVSRSGRVLGAGFFQVQLF